MSATPARVALITGAGQGLGRAFARRLGADGVHVAVNDVDAAAAQRVCDEVVGAGGLATAAPFDVTDEAGVAAGVAAVHEATGRLDVLINNAAVFSTIVMKPFEEITLAEWDATMRVNLGGMFLCARAVAPIMRGQGHGRIINLSSSTVLMGRPNYLHYVTSKSGVIGFTRALARELGAAGVTVNAVMPGATPTEVERDSIAGERLQGIVGRQSIQQPLEPEDIAAAVAFLASEDSRLVTGQTVVVDGGLSFI
jgi:3-oxoacyl-[acyl-carrier protein] reductase